MEEAEKRELLSHLADYLIDSGLATEREIFGGKNFSCPGKEHNDSSPSAHYYEGPNEPHVKCFGCGSSWNLFSLIKEREGLATYAEQIERARELYGEGRTDSAKRHIPRTQRISTVREMTSEEDRKKMKDYLADCRSHILATDYWRHRGFSKEFVLQEGLGFDPRRRRLIIPTDESYVARTILPGDYADAKNIARYLNPKGAAASLMGADALQQDGAPVFLVEGAFDALAIRQTGGLAIALNSTSNARLLAQKAVNSKAKLIIALDGDETGKKTALELAEALRDAGCNAKLLLGAWQDCKDAAEWLQCKGNTSLKRRIETMENEKGDSIEDARQDKETYDQMFHRLKERRPEHATADLMEYWNNVMDEMKETLLNLHQAQHICKTLKLWSVAINRAAQEFEFSPEDMKDIHAKLDDVSKLAEYELKDWEYIYETMARLDVFSSNLLKTVAEVREANPVLKLPQVQHAMPAEEALQEPPKKTAEQIYFALLRQAAKEQTGLLVNEADALIERKLRERKKSAGEISRVLSCSPCLANLPEAKRLSAAKDTASHLSGKKQAQDRL